MKTKKVIVGAMATTMLSLSVCSFPSVVAAGETVQISVETVAATPGSEFSVNVSLADIPSAGIQGCDFVVDFDSSLITVSSVTAGALTDTGADKTDTTSSMLPIFDYEINNDEGFVSLLWSTALDDSAYWLNGEGVFCTITGTVAENATTSADLKIAATGRETFPSSGSTNEKINVGYSSANGIVRYDVKTVDGEITIGTGTVLRGDSNCSGDVNLADAIFIMQSLANPSAYVLQPQGMINGDVYNTGDGINAQDALEIQKFSTGQITEL